MLNRLQLKLTKLEHTRIFLLLYKVLLAQPILQIITKIGTFSEWGSQKTIITFMNVLQIAHIARIMIKSFYFLTEETIWLSDQEQCSSYYYSYKRTDSRRTEIHKQQSVDYHSFLNNLIINFHVSIFSFFNIFFKSFLYLQQSHYYLPNYPPYTYNYNRSKQQKIWILNQQDNIIDNQLNLNKNLSNNQFHMSTIFEQNQKIKELSEQNQRLRQTVNSNRNSQGIRNGSIDFQTKYKKALKQIYEVIQANKQLKEELDKLKTSRHKLEASMTEIRKQEVYKAYDNILKEKNQLASQNENLHVQRERLHSQVQSLEAEINIVKNQKMYLAQQKQALQAKSSSADFYGKSSPDYQQLQIKLKQKQSQYHRTIQNYQQHHIALSKQNKKNQQRIQQLQTKFNNNQKQWRNRFQSKQIQFKDIKSLVRQQYQDQIDNLRKQIHSLKILNTELMTKLQTVQMDYGQKNQVSEYEIQMLNSIKQLRIQMDPLKKQIISLQEINNFEKEQLEREKTALQLKVYELQSDIERYSMQLKNQQDKITKLNEVIKKHNDNQIIVKKLQEQNKILGGRVIVLQSKDIAIQNRKQGSSRLQQKVLQFKNRIQMLLNQKQNFANLKNVSIHQLLTLKSYVVQIDQKLKSAINQNQYASKKYKSYKQKYLNSIKQIKQHELLENTLKSKILGYDKLVQKLQGELEKNVNLNEMEIININSKTSLEQSQVMTIKQKYQSLKEKLVLQQKYNKQELETIKLNYEAKIVDLTIKTDQIASLRESLALYKEKNEQLMQRVSQKQGQLLQLRLSFGKHTTIQNDNQLSIQNQNRQIISSLQQTINRQQGIILKLQSQIRNQQDVNRKRIQALQRQLQDTHLQFSKVKLSASTKLTNQKSSDEYLSQNRKLKNKIAELQNQIILIKGMSTQDNNKNSYQLEFRITSLDIQKNELSHKLQTQISFKRRLQKQVQQLSNKNNELDTQIIQINMQNNRKIQQLKYQISEKQTAIQNLEEEIKRMKSQQRTNLQSSTLLNNSIVNNRQDHSICENKIQRLERQNQSLRSDNQELRNKFNSASYSTFGQGNSFNYELQSLRHQRQQAKLKVQRLQKQVSNLKVTISSFEQQKYDLTKTVNSLKSQISSQRLKIQDQIFQKDRVISQLRSRLQHTQVSTKNVSSIQIQLQSIISQKDRQIAILKSKLNVQIDSVAQLNNTILRYNQQINSLKRRIQSSQADMQNELNQKDKSVSNLRSRINSLQNQVNQLNGEIQNYTSEITRLKRSNESAYSQYTQNMEYNIQQKDRTISTLRFQLSDAQNTINQLNNTINNYYQQILSLKRTNDASHSQYSTQMDILLQQKQKTLIKYKDQINTLTFDLNQKIEELSLKEESYMRIQRQLNQYREYEDEVQRLKNSLNDREGLINRNRFEISSYEEENQRIKKQADMYKQQLQKLRFDMLQRDDQVSTLRLQVSNIQVRLTNQIKNDYIQQITQKQSQISRLNFQIQTIQNNYNQLQYELNQSQTKQRKLQNQLMFIKSQISRYEQDLSQMTQKMSRKESQFNQLNNQVINLRYYEQQVNQKNNQLNKIKGQLTQLRISSNQYQEECQYKETTIQRQNNELKNLRMQLSEMQESYERKQNQLRNISSEIMRYKSQIQDNQMNLNQKDSNIQRLQQQINRIKSQHQTLEEQIQQREQQWSNITFELNQAKTQINLISDQIQAKDIMIAKLSNESAFLKQQITRLNEQIVDKNHEINRINQQVFIHKMEVTNQTNQQNQALSNEIFGLKRQLESFKHTIQDLQSENRRLKIQVDDSRVKFTQKNNTYIYTEEDFVSLRQENNTKYRQIMQLQYQIEDKDSKINLLNQKVRKLQVLLEQTQQEHKYNVQRYQRDIQNYVQNQRRLHLQIQSLVQTTHTQKIEQTQQQLKFGLKLYTQETDRLQTIINQLTEEVSGLKLKLSAYVNQEDRIQQNLVTMVMTFAEIESLRERMKTKEVQINEVRKSLIKAVSSNEDVNSQYRFKTSKAVLSEGQTQSKPFIFEQIQSQNNVSIVKFKSQIGDQNGSKQGQAIKQQSQYEIDDHHPHHMVEVPITVERHSKHSQQVAKAHNVQLQQHHQSNDDQIEQLNQMKQFDGLGQSHVQQVAVNKNKQENNETANSNIVTQQNVQGVTTTAPVNRMINITYQGSQVQPSSVGVSNQRIQQQRISQSHYQAQSNVGSFIRVVPQGIPTNVPQIIHPQVHQINPGIQQQKVSMTVQNAPIQGVQGINVNQSHGGRIIINNQMNANRVITGFFQGVPQNLRH